ncbi:hypothetical protein GE09DRAFT_1086573 [Coniochaeta sp. 2T2.1]|nr:hypothetical protein GE09DRAFT_1086573 [Coniochaeta sp. 2T2.1]
MASPAYLVLHTLLLLPSRHLCVHSPVLKRWARDCCCSIPSFRTSALPVSTCYQGAPRGGHIPRRRQHLVVTYVNRVAFALGAWGSTSFACLKRHTVAYLVMASTKPAWQVVSEPAVLGEGLPPYTRLHPPGRMERPGCRSPSADWVLLCTRSFRSSHESPYVSHGLVFCTPSFRQVELLKSIGPC